MVTTRINLWSGPRNISTALMYSFAQRPDTLVFDEPLYAHYLLTTGIEHPGKSDILATMQNSGQRVINEIILGDFDQSVLFFKQMTHHLVHISLDFLQQTRHLILIRNPKKVLFSYGKVIEQPTLLDIGIKQSFDLVQHLHQKNIPYTIVDSDRILKNPQKTLSLICQQMGIPFDDNMLRWEKGAIAQDGIWAKYWYANVHQSTGFEPYIDKEITLAPHLQAIYEQAKPYYDSLQKAAI